MSEGTRFDLLYETMPWHKVDTVVFDIGNVLIRFAPDGFLEILFPGDPEKQARMMREVYKGKYWEEFDRGTIDYETAAKALHEEYGGDIRDYMTSMTGWIELKTPMEEGWNAARRCKRAGKQIWLLSNYHDGAYVRLREKFASYFNIFDGATISCYLHQIKPEPEIYASLIEQSGLNPERTLFIDDTLKNVEGAMRCGIHGFHMDAPGKMEKFFI
ncbi:MAG: HAD family phosphatase [Clostridia bacterium]|nr:HAD family phosphatase [Clostridia bacterium]